MVMDTRLTRVLLVEDHAVNQKVVKWMLERLQCAVTVASDGFAGVERAMDRPSLILMDCSMPLCDGFEATRRIRSLGGEIGATPIVALTAHVSPDDRKRCLAAGMDGYLVKPVAPHHLVSVLRTHTPWQDPPARTHDGLDRETVEQLLALAGVDDDNFFVELVTDFSRTGHTALTELGDALRREAYHEVRRTAHRLKGTSTTVGAIQLARACGWLEMAKDAELCADGLILTETMKRELGLASAALLAAHGGVR